ncbi:hypothetical protein [Nostoc sp. CALU 546]|uniref:hypothetical protein n=1 Tax=Nostoc sp. CALU 546 TaxID=1867241 RepID=UPI003B6732A1
MLQIIDLKNNELCQEISIEESVSIKGGNLASGANYNTVATAFGIADPRNTTLLFTIGTLKEG